MVLRGRLSYTLHSANWTHGWNVVHGFLQSPLPLVMMHACLLGHSLSMLQPKSSTWGSGTRQAIKQDYHQPIHLILTANVIIFQFAILTWCAGYSIGISCVARLAGTNALMISCRAVSKSCALARINTLLILAGQGGRTFWISETLILLAADVRVRVRPKAGWTWTQCSVVLSWADCIDAASFKWTWIHTLAIDACLSEWALWVTFAAS